MIDTILQKNLKKALVLNAHERTLFLEEIDNQEVTNRIKTLLGDDSELTHFVTSTYSDSQSNTSVNDFQAGDKINQFIIKRLIAKGGMGSVFLAFDEKLKRNVAIKAILPEFSKDLPNQERFKREAQILSQINHPAICQIYDSIENENGNLLILEYIQGEVLDECVLSEPQVLDVFIQIASALKAAHDKGVVHRDLKPDNILINSDNEVKILDFGISKSNSISIDVSEDKVLSRIDESSKLTKAGALMGTLMYMSPEQASLKGVSQSSDIYTFAIIMQQVLTGCSAYNFEDTEDLAEQIKAASIVNTDSVPKKYRKLIKSMLKLNSIKRPNSPEVLKSLNNIKNHHKAKQESYKKLTLLIFIYIAVGLLIWQYFNNKKETEKDKLVTAISNKIKATEINLQNIYSLPIHDASEDLLAIEKIINENIKLINSHEELSAAEKSQFIGKHHLAYGENNKALLLLEESWQKGSQPKELALDLANAYSLEYFNKLDDYGDNYGSAKPEILKSLMDKYLPKIKYYVKKSQSEDDVSLTNALLLWYNEKGNEAIEMLDNIISSQNWKFEAYAFKAYFLRSQAEKKRSQGNNQESTELYMEALSVYQDAKIRGRSYAQAYEGVCRTHLGFIYDTVNRTNINIDKNFIEGTGACEDTLKIDNAMVEIYGLLSKYNYYYSFNKKQKGQVAKKYLIKALQWNSLALTKEDNYRNYNSKAEILALLAQLKLEHGENPLVEVDQSIKANQVAVELSDKKNGHLYSSMIYTLLVQLKYETHHGIDTKASIAKAKEFYQLGFSPNLTNYSKKFFYLNMAEAQHLHAKAQNIVNVNPLTTINIVEAIINDEQKIADDDPYGYNILASVYLQLARYNRLNGKPNLDVIHVAFENSIKANSLLNTDFKFKSIKANILLEMELNKSKLSNSYELNLDSSLNEFMLSLELNSNSANTYTDLANLYLQKALGLKNLDDKLVAINQGIEASDKALKINHKHPFALKIKATLITHSIKFGLFLKDKNSQAIKLFEKAYEINPNLR